MGCWYVLIYRIWQRPSRRTECCVPVGARIKEIDSQGTGFEMTKANNGTVLYITGFEDAIPDEAKRKGRSTPLEWGKFRGPRALPARASLDKTIKQNQFNARWKELEAKGDGLLAMGMYVGILREYGINQAAGVRGWLVNAKYNAATANEIASRVRGCQDLKLARGAIRMLESVGLLIRVPCPDLEKAVQNDWIIGSDGKRIGGEGEKFAPGTYDLQGPDAPCPPETGEGEATGDLEQLGVDEKEEGSGPSPASGQPQAGPSPDRGCGTVDLETGDGRQGDGETGRLPRLRLRQTAQTGETKRRLRLGLRPRLRLETDQTTQTDHQATARRPTTQTTHRRLGTVQTPQTDHQATARRSTTQTPPQARQRSWTTAVGPPRPPPLQKPKPLSRRKPTQGT